MYKHIESEIKKLEESFAQIGNKAMAEHRGLTVSEISQRMEIIKKVDDLKAQLPANRPLTRENFGDGRRGNDAGIFKSLGEQLVAVAEAGKPGGKIDERLYQVRAASGMSESVPSDGGFLVQSDYSNELLKAVYQTGKLGKLCRKIQIGQGFNSIKLNTYDETSRVTGSRLGGIQSYYLGENALITGTKPKFRQMNLILKKLCGIAYATDELMQDSVALEQIITQAFASEFGFMIDDGIVNGTGAGMPLGILNAGSLVSVTKETGQRAATIVAENVVKMWSRLLPGSDATAVWLVNRNIIPQLYTMSLSVGTGGVPLFMPANGISNQPFNTLLGCPVIPIEQAASLGTVGDIILADLENGYVIAEKEGGIQGASSIHIRFLYDELCYRFIYRWDGQPVLSNVITPYKGSDTQSHFVVTATRA